MVTVDANGWRFDCELTGPSTSDTSGTKPDLVFIHGEIHGSAYWEHQIAEFSRDHRCLTYNRRGHVGTGAPPDGYSLDNQRRDLEALIAHFDLENPVLIAVAFGTTIAADYAIHHPAAVRAIVMVAWSELHEAPLYLDRWRAANQRVVAAYEAGGREGLFEFLRQEGGRSVYLVIPPDEPLREQCVQLMGCHPIEEYRHGMVTFAESVPNLVDRFATLDLPVLGVCGDRDPFPDKPEILAAMKNFREAPMFPGACRFVQWQQPDQFNALLRDFLATCD